MLNMNPAPRPRSRRAELPVRTMVAVAGLAVLLAEARVSAQTVAGPISRDNSVYYLIGPTTWSDAQDQALARGGHLVTINDAAENAWLVSTFTPFMPITPERYGPWIGLNDLASEGQYAWVSGQAVTYLNWDSGQPDNGGGCPNPGYDNEDWVHILWRGGSTWNDIGGPNVSCIAPATLTAIIEIPCVTSNLPESTWQGDSLLHGGSWGNAANWMPAGIPAENATAGFELVTQSFIDLDANRRIGTVGTSAGDVNINFHGFTLSQPNGCLLPAAIAVAAYPNNMTSLSLTSDYPDGGGSYVCREPVWIGVGQSSFGSLTVSAGVVVDSSSYIGVGFGDSATGVLDLVSGGRVQTFGGVFVGGVDGAGTVNVSDGGTLTLNGGSPLRLGDEPGGSGVLNIGNAGLVTLAGSNSQLLVGARAGAGVTTVGQVNLNTGGSLIAPQIVLGARPQTRGTMNIDGGLLNTPSLVIADQGDGILNWTGGTITGLTQITIGNSVGTSGVLDLQGPARSLVLSAPGGVANLYAGKAGRGRVSVTEGAVLDLTAGATGGLSIGATQSSGGGGVKIIGHEPGNPFFRSRILGNSGSVLNVGKTYTIPLSTPALLIDEGARASFGSVFVGRENWMDGEIHVKNSSVLQQTKPGADAIDSLDALQIRGTPGGARLLVDSGGQVDCTSGVAFGTYVGGPVVTVTGEGSTLSCSGAFYVAGELPAGGKMRVADGARMTSRDVFLGIPGGGGPGFRGELTLSGPTELLNNSGTLHIGVVGEPGSLGRLVLQNGARVRTNRLKLGAAYFVTNNTANNPQLMVGGSPLLAPDIQCDTLMVSDTFDLPGLDITFGAHAGIGGHGTWAGSFDSTGEVVVPAAVIADGNSPMPRFTIDGNLVQHPSSVLDVAQTCAMYYGEYPAPLGSFLNINGSASISGTLQLTLWTIEMLHPESSLYPPALIGRTLPVLTAATVVGTFDAVEFGPGFPTNRVELTYEPTRVLVTFLPPACEPTIQTQPIDDATCPGGNATFTVTATGSPDGFGDPVRYEWQHYSGNQQSWFPIGDGDVASLYFAQGTASPTLSLVVNPHFTYEGGPQIPIRCVVSNACHTIESNPVLLRVCAPDFDCDGALDFFDYDAFVACFEGAACPPGKTADFDADGSVDFFDYDAFVIAFEAGC